jgi:hypothetical protein
MPPLRAGTPRKPMALQRTNSVHMAVPPLAINLAVDITAAGLTTLAVAPLITAFDEAITRSAAGGNLWAALGDRIKSIITKPVAFFNSPAFRWMFFVYAATYTTTNSLKSIQLAAAVSLGFFATFLVTVVNTSAGILKDSAYSRLFGCAEDGCVITPNSAYVVWFLRDLLAFTFILTLPPVLANIAGIPLGLARFTTPVLAQYFTTPLHCASPPREVSTTHLCLLSAAGHALTCPLPSLCHGLSPGLHLSDFPLSPRRPMA